MNAHSPNLLADRCCAFRNCVADASHIVMFLFRIDPITRNRLFPNQKSLYILPNTLHLRIDNWSQVSILWCNGCRFTSFYSIYQYFSGLFAFSSYCQIGRSNCHRRSLTTWRNWDWQYLWSWREMNARPTPGSCNWLKRSWAEQVTNRPVRSNWAAHSAPVSLWNKAGPVAPTGSKLSDRKFKWNLDQDNDSMTSIHSFCSVD